MSLINELSKLGVNTDDALNRFMNNIPLYEKCMAKFPGNVQNLEVLKYMEEGDYEAALANAHTLKGVTGNLSITPLFTAYTEIVAAIRAEEYEKAKKMLTDILPEQKKIVDCIEANK